MKRSVLIGSSILLALTVVTAVRSAAAADDSADNPAQQLNQPHVLKEKKVSLNGGENNVVRSGPGSSFAIVGIYTDGDEFVVIAKRGEWYNIRLSDTNTGWIHSSLCREFDDMSDLEFRPNPRLFSRVGAFSLTAYGGGYAFDRKSNSLVLGGRLGYHVLEFLEVEGSVAWTHIVRPAEIVESLFNLSLEEEKFHMLFYAINGNIKILPGRQMVPFATIGGGSSILQGETATSFNYGAGINFFVQQAIAFRFEFRTYHFKSDSSGRHNTNYEFTIGNSLFF
jgi:opacity protein-like surface antigen